ncbi:glycerol-3-phosphate 1-O-acyltransferase PlsY [Microvirga sp. W0021]|uniref:Glycerol-3-phosphate acyltransferase n=2 Tax=Hohaiivirga grylli TaxID=3133970 RepID=A0ABV0BKZ2_9HYPH
MTGGLVFGYLCGSIPFGVIFTRMAGLGDIRSIGSGNIGATNVLRTGRKGVAVATLLGDALKGTFAVLLTKVLFFPEYVYYACIAAALGAFIGHLFPVWLHFRGGKGVATFLGCLLGLCWPAALVFAVVWLGVAFISRYSSLAALCASVVSALSLFYFGTSLMACIALLMVLLLWWKHQDNIRRLLDGKEGKIGQKG